MIDSTTPSPKHPSEEGAIKGVRLLKAGWQAWKNLAHRFGDFQGRMFLAFFYFVILSPFVLVLRWGSHLQGINAGVPQGWKLKGEPKGNQIERARRQF